MAWLLVFAEGHGDEDISCYLERFPLSLKFNQNYRNSLQLQADYLALLYLDLKLISYPQYLVVLSTIFEHRKLLPPPPPEFRWVDSTEAILPTGRMVILLVIGGHPVDAFSATDMSSVNFTRLFDRPYHAPSAETLSESLAASYLSNCSIGCNGTLPLKFGTCSI